MINEVDTMINCVNLLRMTPSTKEVTSATLRKRIAAILKDKQHFIFGTWAGNFGTFTRLMSEIRSQLKKQGQDLTSLNVDEVTSITKLLIDEMKRGKLNSESSAMVGGSGEGAGPSAGNQMTERRTYTQEDVDRMVKEAEERGENKMKRKIQEHAECRICLKVPQDGIQVQQCPNGHLNCETCMESCGDTCPTCRIPLNRMSKKIKIRALAIEQIIDAADLDRECKHQLCDFSAPREALNRHENKCQHRRIFCPHITCEVRDGMPFSDIMDHIEQTHNARRRTIITSANYIQTCRARSQGSSKRGCWRLAVVTYQGKQFVPFIYRDHGGKHYAWMYILGDSEEAEEYNVTMHIGEGRQTAIAHHGKIFPIDRQPTEIVRCGGISGVLSFSFEGMGSHLFIDISPDENDGRDKKFTISFSIVTSKARHHFIGLHKLCQEAEGSTSSASATEDDTDCE